MEPPRDRLLRLAGMLRTVPEPDKRRLTFALVEARLIEDPVRFYKRTGEIEQEIRALKPRE